jgi:hypothetical protein
MKCPHCGEKVQTETCPACHGELPAGSRFCCWCGAAQETAGSAEKQGAAESADEGGSFDLDSRILCTDGSCIGVIGPDGRCKECGKPYTGNPEEG